MLAPDADFDLLTATAQLTDLSCNGWPAEVPLAVLDRLPALERLRLAWHTPPSVLDGIAAHLPDLRKLVLVGAVTANLAPVTAMPRLDVLFLSSWDLLEPVDVRPLRDMEVQLQISRRGRFVGLDGLGPGVEINWLR